MLSQLHEFGREVTQSYESFNFARVYKTVANFTSTEVSAFYMDVSKDRLYTLHADDTDRRAVQVSTLDSH